MPPATCHLPPVARKHLTPRTLPRPALTCHGSWCIQANAVPHTRCIILCLSFLSGTSPTRRPFSSSRFILFYFFRIHKSLWRTLSACLAATPTEYFSTFFWPARVKLSIDTFHTHTYSTCRTRGCVAIIVANVANEHFYLPHLGVTIMSTISGVFNGALYLLSVLEYSGNFNSCKLLK